jgi:hypothetical protein
LFNFYNRWIDASGVHEMSKRRTARPESDRLPSGYVRSAYGVAPPAAES